ncbi:hypothetical protein GCM10020221_24910 [Streptomyces thioluteus]|uniref:HTH tetR-type domain-containing protein n=1 Tax=Streptomyces thioluteus TaxID=66431 RepID=A0ABP6JDZ4_STRTU
MRLRRGSWRSPVLDLQVKKDASVPVMARPKQFDPEIAVDQAMEVFWRKGYATHPPGPGGRARHRQRQLYNTFGSKHSLFEQALRRYRDSQALALVEMLEESGPVKARLRKALGFLAEMDLADPDRRGWHGGEHGGGTRGGATRRPPNSSAACLRPHRGRLPGAGRGGSAGGGNHARARPRRAGESSAEHRPWACGSWRAWPKGRTGTTG